MESTTPSSVAIKWTLIGFITSVVLTFVYQFAKIDVNSPVKYINYVFFIAFLILSQKEYREKLGGFVTFGQAFVEGLLFSVFYGILIAIFTYIYFTILSPAVWEQAMNASQQKLEAAGTMSSDQIESTMNITRKYGVIIAVVGIIIGTPIMGAVVSLIGAAIFKKERSPFDVQDNTIDPVS
ncbi:MAG TPA: DUF4199 domain-containing protein [Mucilaginibacter sp.]